MVFGDHLKDWGSDGGVLEKKGKEIVKRIQKSTKIVQRFNIEFKVTEGLEVLSAFLYTYKKKMRLWGPVRLKQSILCPSFNARHQLIPPWSTLK